MRRMWLLVGLIVLLVTGAWWMFLISPRNSQIAELEDERNIAIDTEQRLRVQIQQLEEIRDSEVQYLAALGTLETLIPERPQLEDFIEEINALANATGVDLQTLAPSLPTATDEGSELREIPISVQVEGEFFEILGFMFGLTDMERLVRIDAVAASSSQDELGGTILSASLELRLFTLADLLPFADDAAALPDEGSGSEDGGEQPGADFEAGDDQEGGG